jgi:response regulator of citrate/malate metabolism
MNKPSSDTFLPLNDVTDPADYENDFLLWIEKQVELLRAKKFEQLDLDNLIEEMDSMGKSLRRELGSRLKVLLIHLLKCEFQSEKRVAAGLAASRKSARKYLICWNKTPACGAK